MNKIEAGLFSALSSDTAIIGELGGDTAIYNPHAPQTTNRPYIVFSHAGGGHDNQNPSDIQSHVYMVKAVADESKKAGTIHELILSVLHKQTLTVAGYTNFYTVSEDEIQLTEVTRQGDVVYHRGSHFRIRIDD